MHYYILLITCFSIAASERSIFFNGLLTSAETARVYSALPPITAENVKTESINAQRLERLILEIEAGIIRERLLVDNLSQRASLARFAENQRAYRNLDLKSSQHQYRLVQFQTYHANMQIIYACMQEKISEFRKEYPLADPKFTFASFDPKKVT